MSNNGTTTKPDEVASAFHHALNTSGPEAAGEYLAEDYTQQSDMPVTSKGEWVERQTGLLTPFPDLEEKFEFICAKGNVVYGINHITGTHKGDFDLSQMGLGIIPATGKKVAAIMSVAHIVENGKIVSSTAKPVANMGFAYVLAQLGVEMPQSA